MILLQTIIILILLVLSAFFSGSETALFSITRAQAKRMRDGTPGERAVTRLLRHPDRMLSTIVVANMIVNVLLASIVASLARRYLDEAGVALAIAGSTIFLVIFGEVTPKTVAVYHSYVVARFVALPLLFLGGLLTPVRFLLQRATNMILALLGYDRMPAWNAMTRDEIAALMAMGEAAGVATDRERNLLENILNLGVIEARDIMVPRTEVVGVEDNLSLGEAFSAASQCRHSRLPVYSKDMDDVWGIFSVIDMTHCLSRDQLKTPLHQFRPQVDNDDREPGCPVYPVSVFPETARVDDLLSHMKAKGVSMATLVDEYGGTAGMLTIDDILEEVVGRIVPLDETELGRLNEPGRHVVLDGGTGIREFNKLAMVSLPMNGSSTVGGYVMALLGRLPRAGDTVENETYRFHVIRMVGRRIGALRIERLATSAEKSDGEVSQ